MNPKRPYDNLESLDSPMTPADYVNDQINPKKRFGIYSSAYTSHRKLLIVLIIFALLLSGFGTFEIISSQRHYGSLNLASATTANGQKVEVILPSKDQVLTVNSQLRVTSSTSLDSSLQVGGSTNLQNLIVNGNVNLKGDLVTAKDGSFAGNVTANNITANNIHGSFDGSYLGDGSALTNINADSITSGTLNDSRLNSDVTVQGNTFNGPNELVSLNNGGSLPSLDGSNLNNIDAAQLNGQNASFYEDASNINSGTLADSLLSSNVALLDQANTFSQSTTFDAGLSVQGTITGTSAVLSNAVSALSFTQNGFAVCDTSGNCSGTVSGLTGSGTANTIALFNGSGSVANSIITQNGTAITISGSLNATALQGDGSNVSNVNATELNSQPASYYSNAANLSAGTLSDSRLSSNVALLNAANNVFSGSLSANSFSGNGSGVTAINASNVTTGTLSDSQLNANVTTEGNVFNGDSQLVELTASGALPSLDGSNLSNVNASELQGFAASYFTNATNLSSGTISDSRLSTNVALLNASNTFTGSTDAFNAVTATTFTQNGHAVCDTSGNCSAGGGGGVSGSGNSGDIAVFTGSGSIGNSLVSEASTTVTVAGTLAATALQGDGTLITNLNASNIASGTLSVARGGTGAGTFTSNGVLYGSGTGALTATAAGTTGECLVATTGGAPAWESCTSAAGGSTPGGSAGGDLSGSYPNPEVSGLSGTALSISGLSSGNFLLYNGTDWINKSISGDLTVSSTGVATIASGSVTNAKLANSSLNVTAGSGLSGGGSVALGSSTSLSVSYGSAANSAVQGNTTLICPSGSGNLTGGGTTITLGTGGSCSNINTVSNPSFSGLITGTGGLSITGASTLSGAVSVTGAASSVTIGTISGTTGSLILANSGSAYTSIIQAGSPIGANQTFTLPTTGGVLCTSVSCSGSNAGSGDSNYIQNSLAQQTSANFNIDGVGKAATLNATTALQLNGVSINTAGTLSNLAYLSQADSFSGLVTTNGGLTDNGAYVQAYSSAVSGSAVTVSAANTNVSSTASTVSGESIGLSGSANSNGGNISNGITFNNVTVSSGNSFNGLNFGTGYNNLISSANYTVAGSGAVTQAAGLTIQSGGATISGALTFNSLGAGVVQSTAGGIISSGTLDRNSGYLINSLSTANGGTGAVTFTTNGLLYGNGSGAVLATAAGTTGQCLIATTGSVPTFSSCTGAASGSTPGGSAGGDLTGSYPNPTIAKLQGYGLNLGSASGGQVLLYNGSNYVNQALSGDVTLSSTGVSTIGAGVVTGAKIAAGTVTNSNLVNSSITVTSGSNISATSSVSLGGTLSVAVITNPTFSGLVTAQAGFSVSAGGASITGNSSITGTLGVSGLLTASAGETETGTASLTGTTTINTTGSANTSINTGTNTGTTTIGNASSATSIGGNLTTTGTTTNTGAVTNNSTTTLNGNTAISGTYTLTVGTGATSLGGTLGVTGLTTLSGGATIAGTTGITGTTTINTTGTGTTTIGNASSATSIGGNLTTTGTTTNTGAVTNNSTTTLNGNTSVSGSNTLTVGTGATALGGTLAVTGTTTITGSLSLGTAGSLAGQLNLSNATNTNLSNLQSAAPSGTGTASYVLPSIAGGSSDTVCLVTLANCAGSGGGDSGAGTANYVTRFTGVHTLGTGLLYDNGSLVGVNTTSGSYAFNVNGSAGATTLYQNGNAVCDTSGNCGYASSSGSSNYINNSVTKQTNANIYIAGTAGSVSEVIQGAASQDITDFDSNAGSIVASISSTGSLSAVAGTFSGLLTASAGETETGTASLTGTTTINTTGSANTSINTGTNTGTTTIGNASSATSVGGTLAVTGTTTDTGLLTTNGGITDTGVFSQTGTGTFSTGTGAISLNGATTDSSTFNVTGATTLSTATVQGSGGLTLGSTTNTGLLSLLDGTTDGFTTSVKTATQANNVALTIPADTNTTDQICLKTLNNCAASGGAIGGTGTANYVARYTGTNTLSTGVLYDNGTGVSVGGTSPGTGGLFNVGTSNQFQVSAAGNVTSGTITSGLINGQTISSTASFTGTVATVGSITDGGSLSVTSSATIGTGLTVTAGGATITAGGLTVTAGASTFGGTVALNSLGAATNNTALCYNSSNQVASCSGTFETTTGTDFIKNQTAGPQSAGFDIQTPSASTIGGSIEATSGQTADLFDLLQSSGAKADYFNASGSLVVGTTQVTGARLTVNAFGATNIDIAVKGYSGQTADLQEFQDNNGIIESKFGASGQLTLGTVATTGGTYYQGQLALSDGTNDGFTSTLQSSTVTANQTFTLPTTGGILCTTTTCASSTGSVSTSTAGQNNYIAKFTGAGTIADSELYDSGTGLSVGSTTTTGLLNVGTAAQFQVSSTGAVIGSTYNGQTISSAASFTGSLATVGNISDGGNLTTTGTTTNTGAVTNNSTTTLNGNTAISGTYTLTVGTGATSLGGTLGVTGLTTLSGGATIAGTTGITGTTTINTTGTGTTTIGNASSATNVGGTLGVTGATTLTTAAIQGAGGLSLGSTTNSGLLSFLDGTNDGFNTSLKTVTQANNVALSIPADTNTSDTLCLVTLANCGSSGSNTISTGTANYVARYTAAHTLGTGLLYDNGTFVGDNTATTLGGVLSVLGSGATTGLVVEAGTTGSTVNFENSSGVSEFSIGAGGNTNVTNQLNANAGVFAARGNIGSGDDYLGTATNNNSSATPATVIGYQATLAGLTNSNGNLNTNNAFNASPVTAVTGNLFNAYYAGTGYNAILAYNNGTSTNTLIDGNGYLQNAALNNTIQYTNITGTGALTSGSIASGFGTISTANNITTSATVQGNIVNATGSGSSLQLGGTSINTPGILTNVAYLTATSQSFTGANTFSATGTALTVTNAASVGTLTVTTGGASITGNSSITGTLGVSGLLTASAGETETGTASLTGTTTINTTGSANTSINTGTNTGTTTIGNASSATSVGGTLAVTGTTTDTGLLTTNGGITDTGVFSQTGTGTFSTGTGAISLNGATTDSSTFNVTGATTLSTATVQGSGGLTLGSTTNTGLLSLLDGTTDGFTTSVKTATQANNVALTIPADTNTTDQICLLTLANCVGSGGGDSGAGTANYVTRFTAAHTLGTGVLYDNGTGVSVGGTSPGTGGLFNVGTSNQFQVSAAGNVTSGTITSGLINGQTISSTASFTGTVATVGSITDGGSLSVTSSATIGTGLTVTAGGATITAGGLTVTAGASTFGGNVTVNGSNTFTVGTGATSLGGTLGVTGLATFSAGETETGTASLTGTTTVNTTGSANTSINTGTNTGTTTIGNASSATSIGGNLTTTGTTTNTGAVTNNSTTTLNGNTSVSGSNTLTVGTGATALGGTLAVTGTTTITGSLSLGTAGSLAGQLNLSNATNTNLSNLQSAAPSGTGTASYVLPSIAGGSSDTVCLVTLANCAGSGGGDSGAGTANYVTRFTGVHTLGTGLLYDNGSLVGVNTTSGSYAFNVNGSAGATTLYQNGNAVCDTSGNCGYASSSGSSNYINNSVTKQTNANIYIAGTAGSVSEVIQGAASQDITDFDSNAGSIVASISSTGSLSAVAGTFSGLLTASAGETETGTASLTGTTTINTTGSANTSINTGTNTGTTTIGNASSATSVGGTLAVTGTTTDTGLLTTNGGITDTGVFSQTGTGTFSTGTGAISLNGATTDSSTFNVTGATTLSTATVQGSGGLTLGSTTNTGLLSLLDGTTDGFTTSVKTATQANNVALTIPADTNTTDQICLLTLANCVGSGGGDSGAGTANYVTRFTAAHTLGTGVLYDNGTGVSVGGTSPGTGGLFNVGTSNQFQVSAAGNVTSGTITSGLINGQTISSTASFTGTVATVGSITDGGSLSVTSSATIGTGLTVTAGGATITAGGLTVTAGASTFGGNVTVNGSNTFTVGTGATSLGGTLGVTGLTTLSGGATIAGTTGITGTTTINTTGTATTTIGNASSATNVGGTLGVSGLLTDSAGETETGTASINGTGSATTTIGSASSATTIGGTLGITGASTLSTATIQGAGGLTLGSTTNTGLLKFLDGTTDGFTTSLKTVTQANNVALSIPADTNTSDTLCLVTLANCGSSGSNTISTGTANYVARYTAAHTLGTGLLYDNGTFVGDNTATTLGGVLSVLGSGATTGLVVEAGTTGSTVNFENSSGVSEFSIGAGGNTNIVNLLNANAGASAARGNITSGDDYFGSANNNNTTTSAATVIGYQATLSGTMNTNGNLNTNNAFNASPVTAVTGNLFNAYYAGTGYNAILAYNNGTSTNTLIDGNGYLQNAALNNTIQYTNITGTGALTSGSIASGFGTISTANNITTSANLQGLNVYTPSLDTATAVALTVGGTNASSVAIGNTTSGTNVNIYAGAGGQVNIAPSANAHTITIGTSSGAAQTVTVGSTNSTSTTTLQAGATKSSLTTSGDVLKTTTNSTTALQVQNSGSTAILTVDTSNSKVVIQAGTITAPALVVDNTDGSIALEVRAGGIGDQNTLIGLNAGAASTTATQDTALGVGALQTNTTGNGQVAIGDYALQANTTGTANTAVGEAALSLNTTGFNNTAVGQLALQNNTTGSYNAATGYNSLNATTTGSSNDGFGLNALSDNTSGGNNSAFGTNDLQDETTANYDTGFGAVALQNTTTGGDNDGFGAAALFNNTTGNANTATGDQSLFNNTSGAYNTADGYHSLHSITTGTYDVGIGSSAGYSFLTNSGDTALGYNAGYSDLSAQFSTLSNLQNATAIGAYSQVQESNSIVLGGVDNLTNVGIGTTVPLNVLSVSPEQYSSGTASQSSGSGTISGSGTTWTSAMVGDQFIFADGQTETITAYSSATSLTGSSTTITESGSNYRLHYMGLQVTSAGRVGIGTATPNNSLSVVGNIAASGTITGGVGSPDYAEDITASDLNIGAGDLVAQDPNHPGQIVLTSADYDPSLLGVISTHPGFVTNADATTVNGGAADSSQRPLALAGRVPVNVTGENGAIKAGDYLTASDTPGYAMKATQSGKVVGIAMSSFAGTSSSDTGQVTVYIESGYYNPTDANNMQGGNPTFDSLTVTGSIDAGSINVGGLATLGSLSVTGSVSIAGSLTVGGNLSVQGSTSVMDLTVNGHIITAGTTPAITATAAAGSGASVSIDGNDSAGTITLTSGTSPSIGDMATVTFAKAYGKTPRIILTPDDGKSAPLLIYPDQQSSTSFNFGLTNLPAASNSYSFEYFIVQ